MEEESRIHEIDECPDPLGTSRDLVIGLIKDYRTGAGEQLHVGCDVEIVRIPKPIRHPIKIVICDPPIKSVNWEGLSVHCHR